MKNCPFCNAENKDNSYSCVKCGKKIPDVGKPTPSAQKRKLTGFKIFLITLFSVIGAMIIVLGFLFVFTDVLTTKEVSYEDQVKDEDSNEFDKWELSEEQQKLINTYGYPDEFIVVFDQDNENTRTETWLFEDMEVSYTFTGGKYNSSDRVITNELLSDDYEIRPEDFVYNMKPEDINNLLGDEGVVETDPDTDYKIITYGEGLIVCTFDADDAFLNILRAREIRSD